MFQMIGLFKSITVASIIVPLMGIILGRYLGALSAFFGGLIAVLLSPLFGYPSLIAGPVAAFCAGSLYAGKRSECVLVYLALLVLFGFYPVVGPVWLFPWVMWFHIIGFLVLVSPLQGRASSYFRSENPDRLFFALFVTTLVSTLAGQLAGTLAFEAVLFDANFFKGFWVGLTFTYPVERIIIAALASALGAPLLRVLRSTNFIQRL
jgi:biotin transporter BioY